jgi:choline monooxygenase
VPERTALERRDDQRPLPDLLQLRGSRVPVTVLDRPLFLQRGWDDDELRCFPNSCTHAWYPLVHGAGRDRQLVCGQHGRKFDCEGRFLAQPGFGKDCPDFPRPEDHLRSLPVARFLELLFVSLGAPIAPLAKVMAEVEASVALLPLSRLDRTSGKAEAREVAGNWKQHAWNYMDRFHVGFIHRAPDGLADAIDLPSYRTELYPHAALQWAYARRPEDGFAPELLPERFRDPGGRRVFALWWLVLPNLTLNFYPWGLSINVYAPIPERPGSTLFLWYHQVLDPERYASRDKVWLDRQVDQEDVEAMAQVRRGLRSGFTPRGRFAPTEEVGPHWFHRKVFEDVFGA